MFGQIIFRTLRSLHQQKCLLQLNLFQAISLRGAALLIFVSSGGLLTVNFSGWLTYSGNYPDPFAVYDDLLPGNPTNNLDNYHCSINDSRMSGQLNVDEFSCSIFPKDNHFDIIHVEGRNNDITEVTFYALDLNLGQVLLHWKPITHPRVESVAVGWNSHRVLVDTYAWDQETYSIQVYGSNTHYERPVRIIIVRNRVS